MKQLNKNPKCPSENQGHLTLRKINYQFKHKGKTIVIPDLEIWECDTCGEQFFPYEASKRIDFYKEFSGKLMVRIDPELHGKLNYLAKKHHRSLNQEIQNLLEAAALK